ncbi:MAG TPA: nitroreductase/quinone reductase family protein [Mycobacterium sp.]|nr:nitroreductase/quinone reductase family protein [Mycobacterium sp.]
MNEDAFPDVRWGRDPGPLVRRSIGAFAGSKLGSWCIRKLTPVDHWLLTRSNGRLTVLGPIGVPLLLLTTTGRKSGQRRQIPLAYMREGDRLFLVGSNFGQAHHPAWVLNLLADPHGWVTMGGKEIPVLATQVTGTEHDRIFQKFVDYVSNYDAYRARTDREIRVFALTKR